MSKSTGSPWRHHRQLAMYLKSGKPNRVSYTSAPQRWPYGTQPKWEERLMTQWGYEDNDNAGQDNDNELNGPKALRDAYKSLQKQQEESNAMIRELLNEKKQAQLASVFESLGVPGAASVYQGDADPEKAKAWVQSMQATFGGGNVQGNDPAHVVDSTPPAISPEQQAQLQRMTEAGQAGTPMGNMDAAFAAVNGADNLKDLIAGFQNANRVQ